MNILVTGANGFIGRHLCVVLAEVGCRVTALSRSEWEPQRPVAEGTLRRIRCVEIPEMGPDTKFVPLLAGHDAVVHLAGRAHVTNDTAADPRTEFHRVNVALTESLATAALEAGVPRFVFLSSIGVLGNRTAGEPFDSTSPESPLEAYAESKLEAERRLRTLFADRGTLLIVRPPLVYGPGVKGNFERLMKLVDRVPVLPFGGVRARRSYVHVLNLCSFLHACLRRETESGTYTVCDGEDIPLNELLRMIAADLRKRRWLLPLPSVVLRMLGGFARRRAEIDRLTSELLIDNRDEKQRTGWQPSHTLRSGIRDMVRDFQRKAA